MFRLRMYVSINLIIKQIKTIHKNVNDLSFYLFAEIDKYFWYFLNEFVSSDNFKMNCK